MTPSKKIDAYIAGIADWRGKRIGAIRKTILSADKQIVEEFKWMGSPVWECNGLIAVANAHKGKVKITFDKGAHLPDPTGFFNTEKDGNRRRATDLFEKDKLDTAALKAMVKAAIAHNQTRLKKNAPKKKTAKKAVKKKTVKKKKKA